MKKKLLSALLAVLIFALLCGGVVYFGFTAKGRDADSTVLQVSVHLSTPEFLEENRNLRSVLTKGQGEELLAKAQAFRPGSLDSVVQLAPTLKGCAISVTYTGGGQMHYFAGVLPGGAIDSYLWCVGPSTEGTYARYAITQAEYDGWNNLVQAYQIKNTAELGSTAPTEWQKSDPAAFVYYCDGEPLRPLTKKEQKAFIDFFKDRRCTDGYETDGKLYVGEPVDGFYLYYAEDRITVETRSRPQPAVVFRNDAGQVGLYDMSAAELKDFQVFMDNFRNLLETP